MVRTSIRTPAASAEIEEPVGNVNRDRDPRIAAHHEAQRDETSVLEDQEIARWGSPGRLRRSRADDPHRPRPATR